jgi:hypothetical protein
VLLQACSPSTSYAAYPSSPSGLTASVEQPKPAAELLAQEQRAPEEYLDVDGTCRRSLIQQLVWEGDIVSKVTMATYKDPVLSVTWCAKTQTEIGMQEYPVYELLNLHGSMHFKLKTSAPRELTTVARSGSEATPIE